MFVIKTQKTLSITIVKHNETSTDMDHMKKESIIKY